MPPLDQSRPEPTQDEQRRPRATRGASPAWCAWSFAAFLLWQPGVAAADAEFVFVNLDEPGVGFNDSTPRAAVAGNPGVTLGEQRQNALLRALEIWSAAIDSDVPIEVAAWFEPFGCSIGAATQGYVTEQLDAISYPLPLPLANRLARMDLFPEDPEIFIGFNLPVTDTSCGAGVRYELSGQIVGTSFARRALHEIAHGLGFLTGTDGETGQLHTAPQLFDMLVYDLVLGKALTDMTDDERRLAATHGRQVVWTGEAVRRELSNHLTAGTPVLSTTPAIAGFSGVVSEASFSVRPLRSTASAPLAVSPHGECLPATSGAIVMRDWSACGRLSDWAEAAEAAGAVGALVVDDGGGDPPGPIDDVGASLLGIPVLSITPGDAELLRVNAADVLVDISLDESQLLGADPEGRPFLYTYLTPEGEARSTFSHWDPVARPDLLMEPRAGLLPVDLSLDITRAALVDLGWSRCGDAITTMPETCDDGEHNGEPGACPEDCAPEFPQVCGNGFVEEGEDCDEGPRNRDDPGTACRSDCTAPVCGDGILDEGEECDDGEQNSDAGPGGCRTDCTEVLCGNWKLDPGEECDMGGLNDDDIPNRCRTTCRYAYCGDGVVDRDEECDPGGRDDASCKGCLMPVPDAGVLDAGLPDADGQDAGAAANSTGSGGCGCSLSGTDDRDGGWLWLVALMLGAAATRHTRRRV